MSERIPPHALKPGLEHIEGFKAPFYHYPDLPDKIVRWEEDTLGAEEYLPYVYDLLFDLEDRYGIPTVHTQFAIVGKNGLDVTVAQISDKITDAVPVKRVLDQASHPSMEYELDDLSCRQLQHIGDVVRYGGVYIAEYYPYHQYVYSPSKKPGKRLILVDTDPLAVTVEPIPGERMPGAAPVEIISLLLSMTADIISLEKRTGHKSTAGQKLRALTYEIDSGNQRIVEQALLAIRTSLDNLDETLWGFGYDDKMREILDYRAISTTLSIEDYIARRKEKGQLNYRPFRED